MSRSFFISAVLVAVRVHSLRIDYPPIGSRVSITPLSNLALGVRHCDYVCSASPAESNNDDFHFDIVAAINGDTSNGMISLRSANFPDHLLSPDNQGKVGVNTNPNADDATWQLIPGLTSSTNWTFVTQSKNFQGNVMSLGRTNTNPCNDGPDIIIANSGAGNVDTQTWVVGAPPPPPPPPPTTVTVSAGTVTSLLSPNILGVHSDEGYMHQPQFFLSQMVYGEAFENTNGMRSGWTTILDGSAQGGASLDSSNPFAAAQRPSMKVSFSSGTGAVRFVHRGMGNEGLVFAAKEYIGYVFVKADAATTMTVALRDYVQGMVLNSTSVNIPGGNVWTQIFYDLTPSGSTGCEGIQSDPAIDCNNPFPDYVCIKCAGELSFELTNPGSTVWFGYVRLEPGSWGRFQGLPIRIEAAETLQSMGVRAIRYGGTVGSTVSWKDFRGPVWNRTGLGRTWASSDMSGWGPFDAMDFFEAADISVAVTMSMTVPADYLADLAEYCVGDSTTTWGAQRIADGHPGLYQPFAFEIGNEQYNPNFVEQVKAMEDRATALLGKPPSWFYMFPDNDGLNSADQAAAVAAGLPISRIATDVHVGSSGGIQQISSVFDKSPTFQASAINGEVNAIYGDGVNTASALGRALSEAEDLNTWFNADAKVLSRIIARTASFASERNGHDDGSQWHQGLSFFLPNATWLGPAGQLHAMIASTWASGALSVTTYPTTGPVTASAQKDQAAGRLVVRLVNTNVNPALVNLILNDITLKSTTVKVTTLSGTALTQTNTPANPLAISPVLSNITLGSNGGNVTLPGFSAVTLEFMGA